MDRDILPCSAKASTWQEAAWQALCRGTVSHWTTWAPWLATRRWPLENWRHDYQWILVSHDHDHCHIILTPTYINTTFFNTSYHHFESLYIYIICNMILSSLILIRSLPHLPKYKKIYPSSKKTQRTQRTRSRCHGWHHCGLLWGPSQRSDATNVGPRSDEGQGSREDGKIDAPKYQVEIPTLIFNRENGKSTVVCSKFTDLYRLYHIHTDRYHIQ